MVQNLLKDIYNHLNMDFSLCSYYNHCNSTPCREGKFFQKNHDFNGRLNITNKSKYLVLYRRDLILQLEAHFRFENKWYRGPKQKGSKYGQPPNYNNNTDLERLISFIKSRRCGYQTFIDKWVTPKMENCLPLEYYDIVKDPENSAIKIFNFFNEDANIKDKDIIESVKQRETKIQLQNTLDENLYNKIKNKLEIK